MSPGATAQKRFPARVFMKLSRDNLPPRPSAAGVAVRIASHSTSRGHPAHFLRRCASEVAHLADVLEPRMQ